MQTNFKHYHIFANYPWINPDYHCSPPYLVIGDDLDALLSATLWNTVSNREWRIIGVYHKYQQIFSSNLYLNDLRNAIWLDLDINSYCIKSLGHHLLLSNSELQLPANHLNLNYLRNISCKNFKNKYPLATIHFLMYLFNFDIPARKFAREMIFAADSTWINGQIHRFPQNVKDWIENCVPLPGFVTAQKYFNQVQFEEAMKDYFDHLNKHNIQQGKGQIESNNLKLSGYQFQFNPSEPKQIKQRLEIIESITGWKAPKVSSFDKRIIGARKRKQITAWQDFPIDKIINSQDIFSYVFPNRGYINYTTGINI